MSITLLSPAKINLFLRVLKRRPDGYHDLASLMQTISLADTIHFTLHKNNKPDHLTCTDPAIPTDASNLILKAASLFRKKTSHQFSLEVHLEKNIPHQAGLGGGSSNAATTLWALNTLYGQPAALSDLQLWSAEIGSDVPFFFSLGTAFCTGRGEHVQRVPALLKTNLWIVKPKQGLSTPQIFQTLELSHLEPRNPLDALQDFQNGKFTCYNDLESAAFAVMPDLAKIKQSLKASGFHTVIMTGSGSAFFCFGQSHKAIAEIAYNTRILNRSESHWYTV